MQQRLVDELTGDVVILAPGRALRPDTFARDEAHVRAHDERCPFCAGNESDTPPEVARAGGGTPDGPGWDIRVVPNKYPIVGAEVAGAHEVVVLSPAHDHDLVALDEDAIAAVLGLLRDRAVFHIEHGLAYAQPFVNHGRAAGASIVHPHAQLVVLDDVPPRARERVERFARAGRDLLTDAVARARDAALVVTEGDVPVWCPPASTSPYAMRCRVASAGHRLECTDDAELASLAAALRDALLRMHAVLGDVPYNLVVENGPATAPASFRWWIDIVPRLTVLAGFELGTGTYVNVVAPGTAAAELRRAR